MQLRNKVILGVCAFALAGCFGPTPNPHYKLGKPYTIKGKTYYPQETFTLVEEGEASWYGPGFHGKLTANGEVYNKHDMTAAHRTVQLPSLARVTNLENGRSVIVRVNDRGPFAKERVLDVSREAAERLDFIRAGHARIRFEVMGAESIAMRNAAKAGIDTTGAEDGLNETGRLAPEFAQFMPNSFSAPQAPVLAQQTYISPASDFPMPAVKPQIYKMQPILDDGAPAPRMKPVMNQSRVGQFIFVETKGFTSMDAARSLAADLSSIAPTSIASAQGKFAVRLGPFADQTSATIIQDKLSQQGVAANTILTAN